MTEQQPGSATPKNFELLSNDDRKTIIAKLKDVPRDQVEKFIYENKRKEWALSYEGTKWIVREMADKGEAIRTDGHPKVERCMQDPEWMTCTILGKRVKVDREGKCEMVLDTNVGSARSWTKQKIGKDDNAKVIPDDFWFSKVVSKATRNLQQSMIPNDFKKAITVKLLEIKNGKAGTTQPQQQSQQGQRPPQGASAPAGQATQPSKPAGAQGQPPTQQAPANKAAAPANKPAQQQKPAPNPSTATIEAVQQGFRAVFVQFAKTEDKPALQKILKALTGKTAITDLERGLMQELGPLLRRQIKGEVKWNGMALHEMGTGEQLWPKVESQEEPVPEPQQEDAPPPPTDADIPMF
jgi:hypothetical protein